MSLFFRLILIFFVLGTSPVLAAINIAVIAPKEGFMAKSGNELIEGVQIAVDVINGQGGVLGEKINLVTVDDRCEDAFAISTAQMMSLNSSKNDKISMVIGPYCNNAFNEISDIYAKGKIVRIVPLPVSAEQYNVIKSGMFKISGVMSEEAKVFFDFYNQKFADKNVAVVYDGNMPETIETAFELQQLFIANNSSNRLALYNFGAYGGDYEQMAKEILLNSQVVYILGNAKQIAVLAQNLQEIKDDAVIFIDEYLATGYFFREMGNFAEGVYVLTMENLKDSPEFTEELVGLRLKGKEPKGLGVYGYASVYLWKQLVEQAKGTAFEKISDYDSEKNFVMPWGNVRFRNGQSDLSSGHIVYQIKNGEYAQVN